MCAVVTALTVLPATLAIVGRRVDALGVRFLKSTESNHDASIWYRLSLAIQRRPAVFVVGALAVMV